MLRVVINLRIFFYGWIALNTTLFILSGYLKKIAMVLSMKEMNEFVQVHKTIFLYNSYDIKSYDLTEYIVSYLIAVVIFYLSHKIRMLNQNYRVVQTF